MLEVHRFEIIPDDAVADHLGGPALLRHLVGIQCLCHAGAAVCSMGAFKAGMKALVSMGAITMAIAGHLVHDAWSLGRRRVGLFLGWHGIACIGKLFRRPDCRQLFSLGGRLVGKSWNVGLA